MSKLNLWLIETRPQFLTLSIVLAFLGTTIAWYDGDIVIWHAILAGFGLILTHACVNILNDYFDYRSGIDLAVKRTPFSGGSGLLPATTYPAPVLWLGIVFCTGSTHRDILYLYKRLNCCPCPICCFFHHSHSPLILKHPRQRAADRSWRFADTACTLSRPADIPSMHGSAAFLLHSQHNPIANDSDVEADKIGNRMTMPIAIGKKRAAVIYSLVSITVYIWILAWVTAGFFGWTSTWVMPPWALLALLTLPFAIKGIIGALHSDNPAVFMPGMMANVITVLATQFLLGIGYILGRVI